MTGPEAAADAIARGTIICEAPPGCVFVVPGTPEPWRRARSHGARRYTDPRSTSYADRIRWAWTEAGRVDFGDAPIQLAIAAAYPRPKTHLRRNGQLSAAGVRAIIPSRTDIDNVCKAVMDALNGLAWRDDRQVVDLTATKWWAPLSDPTAAGVTVRIGIAEGWVP